MESSHPDGYHWASTHGAKHTGIHRVNPHIVMFTIFVGPTADINYKYKYGATICWRVWCLWHGMARLAIEIVKFFSNYGVSLQGHGKPRDTAVEDDLEHVAALWKTQ